MDTEGRIQVLKRALAQIESTGKIDPQVLPEMDSFIESYTSYESIDQALVTTLKDQFQNAIKPKREITDVMKIIDNGSIVVYFKSAQMFKVYQKDDIEKVLGGELRTFYKNLGQTYEVVPTDKEQKILIIGDGSLVNSLDKIKRYIISFMKEKGINTIGEKDLICYKNDGYVEIIINNYYVSNSSERKTIVNELLEYIKQKEKSVTLTDGLNRSYYSEITGADMVRMPPGKESIGGFIEPSSGLITNLARCVKIERSIGGNTYNSISINNIVNVDTLQMSAMINSNNNNTVNSNNTVVTTVTSIDESNIEEFIEFIKDQQPDWFVEGKWVRKTMLLEKFVELYDRKPKIFYGKLERRIYTKEGKFGSKSNRERHVLLKKYSEIE